MEPVYYYGSAGTEDVEDIHLAKLGNVIRKIERMGESNQNWTNLGAIKEVFERRQKAWDEAHPEEARLAGR